MSGIILLSQPIHEAITDAEMRAALEDVHVSAIPVAIEPAKFALSETLNANWGDLRRRQEELFETKMRPLLTEHADYDIAYYGLAPIPLAIHLGYLVDRWRASRVYQRHHKNRTWAWQAQETTINVLVTGMPLDIVRSDNDVVIRISVTAKVDAHETAKVVPLSSAEIEVEVSACGEDVLKASSDLDAVALKVKEILDRLKTHRPNARHVHLFAAVPVGLAFRIGTLVSATQHHRVQTYQYFHSADPRHRRAILLGDNTRRSRELTDDDRAAIVVARRRWADDLANVKTFAAEVAGRARAPNARWPALIAMRCEGLNGAWLTLAALHETPMVDCIIDTSESDVDGFRFDEARKAWLVGDDLLAAISQRIPTPDAFTRAGRMLFFHEAVHIKSHRLTEATAGAIRRFPKVLEAVDYEADVWSMLHELAFAKRTQHDATHERAVLLEIVKTAIDTMWAFDDGLDDLDQMEMRRVNRYLIWYWQLLRLERSIALGDMLTVLAKKPIIELAGPRVYVDEDRVFYDLREPWSVSLEIGAQLDDAAIVRHGYSAAIDVPALIGGLRKREGASIKHVLKGIIDQHVTR